MKIVYACSNCKGTNVETKAWVNPNNNYSIIDIVSTESEDCWCNDCADHHALFFDQRESYPGEDLSKWTNKY